LILWCHYNLKEGSNWHNPTIFKHIIGNKAIVLKPYDNYIDQIQRKFRNLIPNSEIK